MAQTILNSSFDASLHDQEETAVLNGISPVHVLEEFAGTLVDIHGQHDQQSLIQPAQLEVLDAWSPAVQSQYQSIHRELVSSREKRTALPSLSNSGLARRPVEFSAGVNWMRLLAVWGRKSCYRLNVIGWGQLGVWLNWHRKLRSEFRRCGWYLANLVSMERVLGELTQIDPAMEEQVGRVGGQSASERSRRFLLGYAMG